MKNEELRDSISSLTDDNLTMLSFVINYEVSARRSERNAALPDDVWLTARQGHPGQVTREQANQLVEAGTHELMTAPIGDQPTDLCWVSTKQVRAVQVPKAKAIELLDAGTHRLATPEDSVLVVPNVDAASVTKQRALELLATGKYKLAE